MSLLALAFATAVAAQELGQPPPPLVERPSLFHPRVFFDFDSARLKPEGERVLDEAMARSRGLTCNFVVYARTDSAGPTEYNQKLSERRAQVVADGLVARGASRELMRIEAYGETRPLAPTEDDVSEPLFRRVDFDCY